MSALTGRLGFPFEGIFRNAQVYKGRSRDTAWFSIIDSEWPAIRAGFEQWLDPANFDAEGHQLRALEECRGTTPTAPAQPHKKSTHRAQASRTRGWRNDAVPHRTGEALRATCCPRSGA